MKPESQASPALPEGPDGAAFGGQERDLGLAEVAGGAVAQLVQVEPGVLLQQDAGRS